MSRRERLFLVYYTVDNRECNIELLITGKITTDTLKEIRRQIAEELKTDSPVIIHNIMELK